MDKLIGLRTVLLRTGLAKSTIYEWINKKQFPKPVKLGSATRWSEKEVNSWIEAHKEARERKNA